VVATIARELDADGRVAYGALPMRENEPELLVANVARLRDAGWSPRYDLVSGLKDTIEWWKKEMKCV
jgi:nucleoside-diphosphate-sugar epimerase